MSKCFPNIPKKNIKLWVTIDTLEGGGQLLNVLKHEEDKTS